MNKLPRCYSHHLHHNNDNNNDLYNSVDTFAPTILQPWVWVPSTPSMLYHLQYICHVKRTKINKKRPGLAHLKTKQNLLSISGVPRQEVGRCSGLQGVLFRAPAAQAIAFLRCDYSATRKKSPDVFNDFIRKRKILTHLQKLPKNFDNLGKIIVDAGFQKLPKVQFIAQSGHTGCEPPPKQRHDWPTYLFTYQRDQMLV